MEYNANNIDAANDIFKALSDRKITIKDAEEILAYVRRTIASTARVLPVVLEYENFEG